MPRSARVGVHVYVSQHVHIEHACIHDCVHVISGCGIFFCCVHMHGDTH